MKKDEFYIKTIVLIFLSWLPVLLFSQSITIGDQELKEAIPLQPLLEVFEDTNDSFTAENLYLNPSIFTPLSQFKYIEPDHSFWLRTNIQTSADLSQRLATISFNHLTFVDLYLFNDDQKILHRQAGAFREKQFIDPIDSRLAFNLTLEPNANYTLLLRVKHIKKYPPNFDFALQNSTSYLSNKHQVDLINSFLLGAIVILLLYTAVLWFFHRYRPYLWLLIFMLGIGLYSFALRPSYTDIFFSERPKNGWLFILTFLNLGLIGLYLLMIDFLELRKNAPNLYVFGRYMVKIMIALSIGLLIYNSITANFYFSNQLNLYLTPIHIVYVASIIIYLRKKLNSAQRYLVYGIVLFGLTIAVISLNSFLFHEKSLISIPIAAKSIIWCISLLFLIGLHKQLQHFEQEKISALEKINDIHLQYNSMVEKKVEERTLELQNTNEKLVEQKALLVDKKNHIEILMDELNHRVKNNLQMLYSLNTLQLPLVQDIKSKQILNEMRGRIKAMMVANEHLYAYKEDQSVTISIIINEIISHLQQIYDHNKRIEIVIAIPEGFQSNALEALPFGLLLTELITNAYKHAFTTFHPHPQIKISLLELDQQLQMKFEDNGQGADHFKSNNSMGTSLIQDLTRQLKGKVTIQHKNGFSYQFIFSKTKQYAHINH